MSAGFYSVLRTNVVYFYYVFSSLFLFSVFLLKQMLMHSEQVRDEGFLTKVVFMMLHMLPRLRLFRFVALSSRIERLFYLNHLPLRWNG